MSTPTTIYERPVELLQHLVRFDTSNPPGNEGPCIAYINDLLRSLGIDTLVRIPVDAVTFGVEGMYRVLQRFGE